MKREYSEYRSYGHEEKGGRRAHSESFSSQNTTGKVTSWVEEAWEEPVGRLIHNLRCVIYTSGRERKSSGTLYNMGLDAPSRDLDIAA